MSTAASPSFSASSYPIAVLISGNGSNLQAIIDAIKQTSIPAIRITHVISNRADAYGLERAKKAGIKTQLVPHTHDRLADEQVLLNVLSEDPPELIVLAGYMRMLSPAFVQQYPNKILNIHPSLLPKYPGLNTHQRVLDASDQEHGCTVHIVTSALDSGPIVAQEKLKVRRGDTAETLKARVLELEHFLYPAVIKKYASAQS